MQEVLDGVERTNEKLFTKYDGMKMGSKVTYVTDYKVEKGIVKSKTGNYAFVVFACGGNWGHYKQYTGQCTPYKTLIDGWLSYEDWYPLVEDRINIELAETGADRELDFNPELEFENRYRIYIGD